MDKDFTTLDPHLPGTQQYQLSEVLRSLKIVYGVLSLMKLQYDHEGHLDGPVHNHMLRVLAKTIQLSKHIHEQTFGDDVPF